MENKTIIQGLGAALIDRESYIFFCNENNLKQGTFTVHKSHDGMVFVAVDNDAKVVNLTGPSDELCDCGSVHVSKENKVYYLTYCLKDSECICIAKSKNLIDWEKVDDCTTIKGTSAKIISDYLYASRNVMVVGGTSLCLYVSEDMKKWSRTKQDLISNKDIGKGKQVLVLEAQVVEDGIFVMYAITDEKTKSQKNKKDTVVQYELYGALFKYGDPTKMIWKSSVPVYSTKNTKENVSHIFGVAVFDEYFVSYWTNQNGEMFLMRHIYNHEDEQQEELNQEVVKENIEEKHSPEQEVFELQRVEENPIMEPQRHYTWESKYVFNPAAYFDGDRVHIIYRAIGDNDVSVFGYAASSDGINIDERLPFPAYVPRKDFEGIVSHPKQGVYDEFVSGGGAFGGCEDPKLTYIDGRMYLTYVAYNGWSHPRLAMSYISLEDFLQQKWHKWTMPVLLSKPNQTNKSGCILPEKINGKYVIFHRIFPNIKIDFVDSLEEFDGKTRWLEGHYEIPVREGYWDAGKLSVASPPMRTKDGWLMIYHAVTGRQEWENTDLRYKIGAMLLDIDDPTKVIARTNEPILEPQTSYENEGAKYGIAYPCGSVIKDDTLFVYYGGSDEFVCVATASLEQFLKDLKRNGEIKMVIN